jgi:hypothetical protein
LLGIEFPQLFAQVLIVLAYRYVSSVKLGPFIGRSLAGESTRTGDQPSGYRAIPCRTRYRHSRQGKVVRLFLPSGGTGATQRGWSEEALCG